MYKIIGNYEFGALSTSDKTKLAMGFETEELAIKHIQNMNKEIETFETDKIWNKLFLDGTTTRMDIKKEIK